ncbi:response regulator [Pendulispora albinea]|uniref:Response regulator n=1 Tax=Pendulispora albinea TaxID=2741071 RepID=A0ABZ2M7H0_9BACT
MPNALIVDDSKVMRDMIIACLRPLAGLSPTEATSGLDAIEQLSLQRFDLLVLDLNMPDIGGLEVIEFVRAQDKLRELPILVVTTRDDQNSRTRILSAGASQYLTKPFTPAEILSAVQGLLPDGKATG